jgi:hypothetical protein
MYEVDESRQRLGCAQLAAALAVAGDSTAAGSCAHPKRFATSGRYQLTILFRRGGQWAVNV